MPGARHDSRLRPRSKPTSRESFLLLNNALLVAALSLILLGTLYPLFMDALELGKVTVGAPWFNLMFLVPMLPLVALLGVGMHAAWKRGLLGSMKAQAPGRRPPARSPEQS